MQPFKGHHIPCVEKGEITHIDLWGKYDITLIKGNQYYLLLIDDATRYMILKFLKAKTDVTAASCSVSALDYSYRRFTFLRAFASCSRRMMDETEVPALQLHLQDPLRVERNKVRLRQETQLSDTGIAKALFMLLVHGSWERWYR